MRLGRRLRPLPLLLALATACAPAAQRGVTPAGSAAVARDPGRGPLFVVGGGPQPDALVRRFVDLAGGPGKARIVVLAMASELGAKSGEEKAEQLRGMGADARSLWFDRAGADADSLATILRGATGIWFGGGDQNRLTRALLGSRALAALQSAWREHGAVVGGTSAGAAVLSTPMITGDERHRGGARYPSDSGETFMTIERDNVVTAEGFGFLTDVIVDQHFVRRRRHNRLLSLALERAPHIGAGIDESTALIVWPDGTWSVEGESVVVIYDARGARIAPRGERAVGASDVRVHVLPAGSRFDPRAKAVTLP